MSRTECQLLSAGTDRRARLELSFDETQLAAQLVMSSVDQFDSIKASFWKNSLFQHEITWVLALNAPATSVWPNISTPRNDILLVVFSIFSIGTKVWVQHFDPSHTILRSGLQLLNPFFTSTITRTMVTLKSNSAAQGTLAVYTSDIESGIKSIASAKMTLRLSLYIHPYIYIW